MPETSKTWHDQAMALCDQAEALNRKVKALYVDAAEHEAMALRAVDPTKEPRTYSILALSLACLWLRAGRWLVVV